MTVRARTSKADSIRRTIVVIESLRHCTSPVANSRFIVATIHPESTGIIEHKKPRTANAEAAALCEIPVSPAHSGFIGVTERLTGAGCASAYQFRVMLQCKKSLTTMLHCTYNEHEVERIKAPGDRQ